eukprot:gene5119-7131_t
MSNGISPIDIPPTEDRQNSRRRGIYKIANNDSSNNDTNNGLLDLFSPPKTASYEDQEKTNINVLSKDIKKETLLFPQGLTQKPLDKYAVSDNIESRLMGLPGSLKLDAYTSNKYFGNSAKNQFFERYRWVNHQRNITAKSSNENIDKIYFENEKPIQSELIPFGPIRKPAGISPILDTSMRQLSKRSFDYENLQLRESYARSRAASSVLDEDSDNSEEIELEISKALKRDNVRKLAITKTRASRTSFDHGSTKLNLTVSSNNKSTQMVNDRRPQSAITKPKSLSKISTTSRSSQSAKQPSQESKESFKLALPSTHSTVKKQLETTPLQTQAVEDLLSITESSISSIGFYYGSRFNLRESTVVDESADDSSTQEGPGREPISSPRTKYIANCIKHDVNPHTGLLLRKNLTKQLNLQHQGMGDIRAQILAESIKSLPFIESINIADNRLTDDGMGPLILSILHIPNLIELNLSQNEIGPVAAKALFDYLVSSECPLERLILQNADVDDFECDRFIEAVKVNKSLRELDLSQNKIGTAENLNTVMPDLTTGGEAIANLLQMEDCRLQTLKLQWNNIRLDSANELARSISVNSSLTYLDLSFNSLATEGGIIIGESLLKNKSLSTLILSNNSIDAAACITICAGIIENRSLKTVILDGNPIGEQGARVVLIVPLVVGNRVRLKASNCNISIRDASITAIFDMDNLVREYTLDLSNGFHRGIAILLMHVIAGHPTLLFEKVIHEVTIRAKGGVKTNPRVLDLIQSTSMEKSKYFDEKELKIMANLMHIKNCASDIQLAVKLFQEVDQDGSGEIDIDELKILVQRLGLTMTDKRIGELMKRYDDDQTGKIEIQEFLLILRDQYRDAIGRLRDMSETSIMILKSNNSINYIPPDYGVMRIFTRDGFVRKAIHRVMTSMDREHLSALLTEVTGAGASSFTSVGIVSSALSGAKIRLDEALATLDKIVESSSSLDKVKALAQIVPQMNDTIEAQMFVQSVLGDNDRSEMLRLKREMGAALKPILGAPNGYYKLDLSREMDRLCVGRLIEISSTYAHIRSQKCKISYGRVGDLSQKGNWSSFRNEMFNGQPITINAAFCTPIPRSGKLEFDFSGGGRPTRDVLPCSDIRIVKILVSHFLMQPSECAVALYRLNQYANVAYNTLVCNGTTYYEVPMDRARMIGEHMDAFYSNLNLRSRQFDESIDKEQSVILNEFTGELVDRFEKDKFVLNTGIGVSNGAVDSNALDYTATLTGESGITTTSTGISNKRESVVAGGNRKASAAGRRKSSSVAKRKSSSVSSPSGKTRRITTINKGNSSGNSTTETNESVDVGKRGKLSRMTSSKNLDQSQKTVSYDIAPLKSLDEIDWSDTDSSDDDDDLLENGLLTEEEIIAATEVAKIFANNKPIRRRASTNTGTGSSKKINKLQSISFDEQDEISRLSKDIVDITTVNTTVAAENLEEIKSWEHTMLLLNEMKIIGSRSRSNNSTPIKRKNIAMMQNYLKLGVQSDYQEKLQLFLSSPTITHGAKAHRIIEILEDVFARSWIFCRHMVIILDCFRNYGYIKQTRLFGTYRVDLIVALFARIIDLHNFEFIMEVLSPFESACLICRIGWLNIYNPCKLEGSYELDLSRREERIIGKTLCILATFEPGDNWTFQKFRWTRNMESMPGWELTQPWLTEDGMPKRGLLNITYYSGEGKHLNGCKPYVIFRKSLLNLVLISEDEVVGEDVRNRPPKLPLSGDLAFTRHRASWEYLAPDPAEQKKKK